ncbi:hypothetical protein PQQ51_18430 [Paraburkholderia xenovorans]|uniref:hypothetical protein n=1 Tax=Paraburkholderia xenovorans TaxID=36873 RepID=UPI0038B8E8C9
MSTFLLRDAISIIKAHKGAFAVLKRLPSKSTQRKFSLLTLLPLAACVGNQLDTGWQRLRGQPLSMAVDRLGVPNSDRTLAGRHVYTWTTSQTVSTYQASSSFTTANASRGSGGGHYTANTFGGTMVPTNVSCKIDIEVDSRDVMTNMSYDGTISACARYAQAMNR